MRSQRVSGVRASTWAASWRCSATASVGVRFQECIEFTFMHGSHVARGLLTPGARYPATGDRSYGQHTVDANHDRVARRLGEGPNRIQLAQGEQLRLLARQPGRVGQSTDGRHFFAGADERGLSYSLG